MTPFESPTTRCGAELFVNVPSPSWPESFLPQQYIAPESISAQVWSPPVVIAVADPGRPTTFTGVALSFSVPSPSWPSRFRPQHWTVPPETIAHVCPCPPPSTATTGPASPETSCG